MQIVQTRYVIDNGSPGVCNICGKRKKLSEEHVPPKSGMRSRRVRILKTLDAIQAHADHTPIRLHPPQDVIYRTTCVDCNNSMSGFDYALNRIAIGLRERYRIASVPSPSPSIRIRIRPYGVIRSILGHVIAARKHVGGKHLEAVNGELLFDKDASIPDNIKIFYWFHAYDNVELRSEMVMPRQPNNMKLLSTFSLMKYQPLGFLVSDDCEYIFDLPDLCIYRHANRKDAVDLDMKVIDPAPSDCPEGRIPQVGGDNMRALVSGR